MKSTLDYRDGHLCILNESERGGPRRGSALGKIREWYAVRQAAEAEVATLVGRPVRQVEADQGLYVDEDGEAYQLTDKGGTKPIAIEQFPRKKKTEREVNLEASQRNGSAIESERNSRPVRRRTPNIGLKAQRVRAQVDAVPKSASPDESPARDASGAAEENDGRRNSTRLNLHQKLAEVRRRIGYVQKRGRNERFNYNYVTAADIAGAVGDLLSQLGVVIVPSLDSISYEPVRTSNGQIERVAHVVMTYSLIDVDTGESVTVKVPGEGLDAGDKAPYKAMTGALKYALLQSFLLATGDDPEEERTAPSRNLAHREHDSGRPITAEESCQLRQLVEDTGTELERVLAYYKIASLEEMTETAYRRAIDLLSRKLAKRGNHDQEAPHAQD